MDTEHGTAAKQLKQQSKAISWLLRHGAPSVGVAMDEAGWSPVPEVLAHLGITQAALETLIEANSKRRIELVDGRVRCCQGHSRGMPVTADALEASWTPSLSDDLIWHGTTLKVLDSIDAHGIEPGERTHVHLAKSVNSSVGIRSMIHVALAVSPVKLRSAGYGIFTASNGVILVRRVPRECIVGVVPCTRRARRSSDALYQQFGRLEG